MQVQKYFGETVSGFLSFICGTSEKSAMCDSSGVGWDECFRPQHVLKAEATNSCARCAINPSLGKQKYEINMYCRLAVRINCQEKTTTSLEFYQKKCNR